MLKVPPGSRRYLPNFEPHPLSGSTSPSNLDRLPGRHFEISMYAQTTLNSSNPRLDSLFLYSHAHTSSSPKFQFATMEHRIWSGLLAILFSTLLLKILNWLQANHVSILFYWTLPPSTTLVSGLFNANAGHNSTTRSLDRKMGAGSLLRSLRSGPWG